MKSPLPPDASEFLDRWLGEEWDAVELAGDASVRRYYRVTAPGREPCVVAWYPPALRADVGRFLAAHEAIRAHAPVPAVLARCESVVAQSDVGNQTLFDVLMRDRGAAVPLYRDAVDLLAGFQKAPPGAGAVNPPFDAAKFLEELEMTREFYVEGLMGRPVSPPALAEMFRAIAESLTRHPYVLCHRDYHGQNLHLASGRLYMIDFQDLRMGPDTYDLASLLRDRGAGEVLGQETEEGLIEYYRRRSGGDPGVRQRYFETLLQRSIKTLGTFAKQAITRGRIHYVDYLAPALAAVRRCSEELPAFRTLPEVFPAVLTAAEADRIRETQRKRAAQPHPAE